jgi:hypothetical protein
VLEFIIPMFLIAQHVSGDTPLIIRSSKTVIAASGFTYVFGSVIAAATGNQKRM